MLNINKKRQAEKINAKPKSAAIPAQKIVDLYHEHLPMLRRVAKLTEVRKSHIRARWSGGELPDLETWKQYFEYVKKSKFLIGQGSANPVSGMVFRADFDFLIRESAFVKIWEGKYHEQIPGASRAAR